MKIQGEKINLRPIKLSDFEKIMVWHQNELLAHYICKRLPKNLKECQARYLYTSKFFHQILAIEDKNGNFLGEIEMDHIKWKNKQAELFMYIGEESFWDKGYGSDALATFLKYIFEVKGFKKLYLRVYEDNKRAIRCYEKCGFKKRGILRLNNRQAHAGNLILMDIACEAIQKQ